MTSRRLHQTFTAMAVLIVGAAVVWGFVLVGSPNSERLRKIDARRVADLREIHQAIERLWVEREPGGGERGHAKLKQPLPRTLQEIVDRVRREGREAVNFTDPLTGESYAYALKGETEYELCATFALKRDRKHTAFWNHPAGRHCFSFDALAETAPDADDGWSKVSGF